MKYWISGLIGACLVLAGPAYAKDWTWEITTRMDMPGMPAGFGNQKSTSCIGEGKESEPDPKKQSDCKVLERSSSGKITRMTMKCKEGTMKVEHEQINPEHWRSKMQMNSGGDEMIVHSEGRRLEACDLAKDGHMSKETKAQLAGSSNEMQAALGKDCQRAADQWPSSTSAFTNYDQMVKGRQDFLASAGKGPDAQRMADASYPDIPGCAKAKPVYCSKAKSALTEMGTRKGYAAVMKRAQPASGVDATLAYCGVGKSPRESHCKASVAEADYGFVVAYCPDERKALARQHCAGRGYTAIEDKYRILCGGGSSDDSVASSSSSGSGSAPAKDAQTEAVEQGVKEGVKAIKGLFNF